MSNEQIIEDGHQAILNDFKKLYIASKPSFKELQAQERAEAIQRIKNHLFATLLCQVIKENSGAGNTMPAQFSFKTLLEIICNGDIGISIK